jgi:hypothetical protein
MSKLDLPSHETGYEAFRFATANVKKIVEICDCANNETLVIDAFVLGADWAVMNLAHQPVDDQIERSIDEHDDQT